MPITQLGCDSGRSPRGVERILSRACQVLGARITVVECRNTHGHRYRRVDVARLLLVEMRDSSSQTVTCAMAALVVDSFQVVPRAAAIPATHSRLDSEQPLDGPVTLAFRSQQRAMQDNSCDGEVDDQARHVDQCGDKRG